MIKMVVRSSCIKFSDSATRGRGCRKSSEEAGVERDVADFGRLRQIAVGFGGGKAPETQLAEGAERTASIDEMGDSWRIYERATFPIVKARWRD